ncbi:hypothetical protein JNUCC1_02171 [Lentibacillus sp. JNUCC-1]|uniref:DUF4097 family beta strand repeat-containing protein n=1 Tax=Lentibacillus sp. JNUCC-1 TaxID=2654513 RepID=UPI0012E75BCD|nr:DUF4097 family beta strand repeat-containing protein [Lentibacillus sp. JNUCC-1]MUV38333.1 hypothetical protein [Lentibacillus sp. JNUCC-1]
MEKKSVFKTVVDSIWKEVHDTPEKTIKEASVEIGDLTDLMIETDMTNVEVKLHNQDRVDMVLESFAEGPELEHDFDDHQGRIYAKRSDQKKRNFHFGFLPACRLQVTVPADVAERWSVKTTSGNIQMGEIQAEVIALQATSGNIELAEINAPEISLKASSGNMQMHHIQCDQAEVILSSGNMNILNLKTNSLLLKASSGNMRLEQIRVGDKVECKLSSGHIRGENIQAAEWTVKLSSGHAKIHGFSGHAMGRISSGKLDFGVKGDSSLDLTSTSGHISVTFEETPDAAFNISAPPENISTNLSFEHVHRQGARQTAVIGNGTQSFKLKTSTGRIRISDSR